MEAEDGKSGIWGKSKEMEEANKNNGLEARYVERIGVVIFIEFHLCCSQNVLHKIHDCPKHTPY